MLNETHYPSDYFDPYYDEPTHVSCCECGEWVDFSDAEPVEQHDPDSEWICDWCAGKV